MSYSVERLLQAWVWPTGAYELGEDPRLLLLVSCSGPVQLMRGPRNFARRIPEFTEYSIHQQPIYPVPPATETLVWAAHAECIRVQGDDALGEATEGCSVHRW